MKAATAADHAPPEAEGREAHVKRRRAEHAPEQKAPRTLAVDVGGTHIKADVLDEKGRVFVDKAVVPTPHPCPPKALLRIVEELVETLPAFDRVSVGFPGVVRRGIILTAPHLATRSWYEFDLTEALSERLGKPVRVLNDADVQGFGLIDGRGLEMVLTLGTSAGTALFRDGDLMPHLELAHHPMHKGYTYDEYIGDAALRRKGQRKWSRRVGRVVMLLRALVNFDVLHIGGGNAGKFLDPPEDVKIGSNLAGLTGGIRLWEVDASLFSRGSRERAEGKRGRRA
jgi:polyphosphate glucokinase